MVKEIIRKLKRVEIKGVVLTFEGYQILAKSKCGRIYNFVINEGRVLVKTAKGYRKLPPALAKAIEEKFIIYSLSQKIF